ncbi:unnamed protein product [Lymnaea stagnalis]|uniref:Uncharacterized protein n=1 Tax=Lymnaea stagnalis TaxID=6523 RepID=A0AAV2HJ23_LYMST
MSIVTMDQHIYILKGKTREFKRFDVTSKAMTSLKSLPNKSVIEHATKFEKKILMFVSQTTEGADETVIHCYDTVQDEWTRLNTLQGPTIKLTTFKDDQHTYVLQTNGDVWKVVKPQSDVVDFEYVTKLWGCDWTVHGAVTYLDTLYIYGDQSTDHTNDVQVKHAVPGVFSKIVYMDCDISGCTAFMPATVTKGWLQKLT